jgi:hypothetical protein
MRRKLLYATGFMLMAVVLNSCEGLFENCKLCRQVTYRNGNVVKEDDEREYCGDQLVTVMLTAPTTLGNGDILKYECR